MIKARNLCVASQPAVLHRESLSSCSLWVISTELFELLSVSLLLTATVCWRWEKKNLTLASLVPICPYAQAH